MSRFEIVKRPEIEPLTADADPQADWRKAVLRDMGCDEDGHPFGRRRHAIDWRGFVRGLINGFILFAIAFAVVLGTLFWREGAFDGLIEKLAPVRGATVDSAPKRWMLGEGRRAPNGEAPADAGGAPWPDVYAAPTSKPVPPPPADSAPAEVAAPEIGD